MWAEWMKEFDLNMTKEDIKQYKEKKKYKKRRNKGMGFLKRIEGLLTEIHFQLKRNANESEKRNKILEGFKADETTGFKITADTIGIRGTTLTSAFDELCAKVNEKTTKDTTQEMIEREIKYQEELKEVQVKYPEMLDLITTITTNYANMDKYNILDTTKMFSNQYIVVKAEEN